MDALLLAVLAALALLTAYFTYGRWLSRRVFRLREDAPTPAVSLRDDRDYCPTKRSVVFGHHFTSIAGTGPIVGPAIAVMWGWLPAILWVVIGSIFIGAVHDLGSLVVSLRSKGRSVGDVAGDLLGPRVRYLFLTILIVALWIVLAIFGLVIAAVLRQYPSAIFPVIVQIPLAVGIGVLIHRKGKSIVVPSIVALAIMYATVVWGDSGFLHGFNAFLAAQPTWLWVVGLLGYAYVASVLPVWSLLQPRDYINALQLLTALGLLVAGLVGAAVLGGRADAGVPESLAASIPDGERVPLELVAPVVNLAPEGAPPMIPVLFITIACGAISGFHCLVSSGTTSKQLSRETDAQAVGYGSMLTEGFLATLVILACAAGIGLGVTRAFAPGGSGSSVDADGVRAAWTVERLSAPRPNGGEYLLGLVTPTEPAGQAPYALAYESEQPLEVFHFGSTIGGPIALGSDDGNRRNQSARGDEIARVPLTDGAARLELGDGSVVGVAPGEARFRGRLAFAKQYESWGAAGSLAAKVGAFVDGAANLIASIGVDHRVALALMGVLVASFAGTTMDTACRLQRYVIQEFGRTFLPRPDRPRCRRCGYDLSGMDERARDGEEETDRSGSPLPNPLPPGEGSREESSPPGSRAARCPECGIEAPVDAHDATDFAGEIAAASPLNPGRWLATTHGATVFAVVTAAALAFLPAPGQGWSLATAGSGGLLLWPLFGATNQLLGGLAFIVIATWLIATKRPWWFVVVPTALMLALPAWALTIQAFLGAENSPSWVSTGQWALAAIAAFMLAVEAWMVIEVFVRLRRGAGASGDASVRCPGC